LPAIVEPGGSRVLPFEIGISEFIPHPTYSIPISNGSTRIPPGCTWLSLPKTHTRCGPEFLMQVMEMHG
jgi:hypothetical protein